MLLGGVYSVLVEDRDAADEVLLDDTQHHEKSKMTEIVAEGKPPCKGPRGKVKTNTSSPVSTSVVELQAPSPTVVKMHFDCDAGYLNWENGWSLAKIKWCCMHKYKACSVPTPSPTPRPTPAPPAPPARKFPKLKEYPPVARKFPWHKGHKGHSPALTTEEVSTLSSTPAAPPQSKMNNKSDQRSTVTRQRF
eukprot:TRINITY_DN12418_c0_g2_i1.p1 TRINITY_DN12418_c0_g2~~TRINITY_DN12418_c0_g2_i1.p1  ORF type:complete len:224 (+),score=32.92 TRINITY_DN12418_c0_g2_i1:98-673(+)